MREHEYFVYIVGSNSGTLYIGMTNSIYRRALQHKRGEIEGFATKYSCNRLVYYESFDDVLKAIRSRKTIEEVGETKKDCADRIEEPPLGRFSREMGLGDGISESVDQEPIALPPCTFCPS